MIRYRDYKGPQRGVVIRNGKPVPFDYDAALRLAKQAHLLAGAIPVKPESARPGR